MTPAERGMVVVAGLIVLVEVVSWLVLRNRKPKGLDKTADDVQAMRRQR